jgi:alpha-beta hydrolase superfamily lysophospholipase
MSTPTELVALDFPGHGLSGHKSADGPPQLLAEFAYYVAECLEALQWGSAGGENDGEKVIIIGHSMGGMCLICLLLVSCVISEYLICSFPN